MQLKWMLVVFLFFFWRDKKFSASQANPLASFLLGLNSFFFCCFRSIFLMKPPHKPVFEGKRRNYAVGRKNSRMSGGRERDTEIRGVSQSVSFAYISLVSWNAILSPRQQVESSIGKLKPLSWEREWRRGSSGPRSLYTTMWWTGLPCISWRTVVSVGAIQQEQTEAMSCPLLVKARDFNICFIFNRF